MRLFLIMASLVGLSYSAGAQVDTINTHNLKLNTGALKEGRSSFAVYYEDSLGNRVSSADIWDRSIRFFSTTDGRETYQFDWQWYRRDTLIASVAATGLRSSLQPLTHEADYRNRGHIAFAFNKDTVTIPAAVQRTLKDSAFRVVLHPAAFEFPMDLEIFPLLPYRKVGQRLAIAFYEPGTLTSAYYPLTVTGKEDLLLPGGQTLPCWLLRIDYAPGSYATFWIADQSRVVVKMKEYFRGRYRYKVRLY